MAHTFKAKVIDAGGGHVTLLVDRDTENYPKLGARAQVTVLDPLVEAAQAVVDEWQARGDGGCTLALQEQLVAALELAKAHN